MVSKVLLLITAIVFGQQLSHVNGMKIMKIKANRISTTIESQWCSLTTLTMQLEPFFLSITFIYIYIHWHVSYANVDVYHEQKKHDCWLYSQLPGFTNLLPWTS